MLMIQREAQMQPVKKTVPPLCYFIGKCFGTEEVAQRL